MGVIPIIRTSRSRDFYLAYLQTGSWRITRNRALKLVCYRCERCGSGRSLEVHHKSYERLGREWDQDLEVLCSDCHEGHHDVERAKHGDSQRIYLKLVGLAIHQQSVTTFSDLAEFVKIQCAKLKIPYDSRRIGNAIALVTGKQKPHAPIVNQPDLVVSSEPLNKAEALRIMWDLTEKRPFIRTMPGAPKSAIDIYAPVPRPNWGEHDLY
jgi:hypothetical protein